MSKKLFVSALVTGLATTALLNAQDANAAAPELTVPKDQYVEYGTQWNPYEGVKAYDAEDGDLTGDVLWDSAQYFTGITPGTYSVEYNVWDFDDNLAIATSNVHVLNEGEKKPQVDAPTETEVGTETNENPQVGMPTEDETEVNEPTQEVPSEEVPVETNETPQVDAPTENETPVDEPAQEVPNEDVPVETPDTETNETPQVDAPAENETEVDEPTQEVPNEDVPTVDGVENETSNTENPQTDETTSNNGQQVDQSVNDNSQVGGLLTGSEQGVKPEDIAAAKARYEAEQKKKEHEAKANKGNLSNAKSTDVNKQETSASHQGVKSSPQVHQSGLMEATNQDVNTNGMQSSMKQQVQGSDEKDNTMQLLPNTGQEQSNGMLAGLMALLAGVATFFGFRRKSSQK